MPPPSYKKELNNLHFIVGYAKGGCGDVVLTRFIKASLCCIIIELLDMIFEHG